MRAENQAASPVTPAMREGAARLVAAGNTVDAVAAVFGVSADILRDVMSQPAQSPAASPKEPLPESGSGSGSGPAWHHFPDTVFYPCPNYSLVWVMCILFCFAAGMAWIPHTVTPQPMRGLFFFFTVATVPTGLAAVQLYRAARVAGFEMRPNAVAKYALPGCSVLPYTAITGLSKGWTRAGDCYIQLFTRHGVGLTIVPRREQLEDAGLAEWIDSVSERVATCSAFVKATMVVSYAILAVGMCLGILTPAIDSVKDTYKAKAAMAWPTTDGQVTESWPWVRSGRGCTRGVRLSYTYTYTYTVQHLHYTGHRYQSGDVCTADVRAIAAVNPVGRHIAVHYRPGNPADSVLAPGGVTFNMIYRMVGGIGMTAFFLFMFHRRTRGNAAARG